MGGINSNILKYQIIFFLLMFNFHVATYISMYNVYLISMWLHISPCITLFPCGYIYLLYFHVATYISKYYTLLSCGYIYLLYFHVATYI